MTPETSGGDAGLLQELAEARAEAADLRRRLEDEVGTLEQLIRISALLNSTLNLPELLRRIMSSAKELLGAEVCSIMLKDEETGDLVFEVSLGERSEEVTKLRIPIGQGIAGHVAQTGEPLIIDSVKDSPFFYGTIDSQVGFETRNMLAVPIQVKDRVIGVVEVINIPRPEGLRE